MGNFSLKTFVKGIYAVEPRTPEEIEILRVCKINLRKNMLFYGAIGFGITSAVNVRFWRFSGRLFKVTGPLMGLSMGCIYGIIQNTEFYCRRFNELGVEYELGRYVKEQLTGRVYD